MLMRRAIEMIWIMAMLGILPGATLWAAGLAPARTENVPLASSLQLVNVIAVRGGGVDGTVHPGDWRWHRASRVRVLPGRTTAKRPPVLWHFEFAGSAALLSRPQSRAM